MDLYKIKRTILNLSSTNFFRFYGWFEKYGCERINKHTKSSKVRQAILYLSDKEMDYFWYWLDDLWGERWAEEVENDPLSRKCRDFRNMIMSKPDSVKFIADLRGVDNEIKDK